MKVKHKTVIIVAGPTASGKTAMAIELALHFKTEIISADSRQCYQELNIGVARPTEVELAQVPHYFIASHSIHQKINAAAYEQYALQKLEELFNQHDTVIVVGGTGLYIKALCEGLDDIPDVPEELRQDIITQYKQNGLAWLQAEVQTVDPQFYAVAESANPHRLMRALEVVRLTGQSILHFRKGSKEQRDFQIIKLALELPKEQLYDRINRRVDSMMDAGLLEEVKSLVPYQQLNALQTVGYKELFDYLNDKTTLVQAVDEIKKNTRHYAKRQMTWFRKDKEFQWFDAGDRDGMIDYCEQQLK
jgi:tRNA dimethylallyltransferase